MIAKAGVPERDLSALDRHSDICDKDKERSSNSKDTLGSPWTVSRTTPSLILLFEYHNIAFCSRFTIPTMFKGRALFKEVCPYYSRTISKFVSLLFEYYNLSVSLLIKDHILVPSTLSNTATVDDQ
jgi:hypothetical protein